MTKDSTAPISRHEAIAALRTAIDIKAETHIKIWQAYIACLDKEQQTDRKG